MLPTTRSELFGVILRVGIFVLLVVLGLSIFPLLIALVTGPGGYVIIAALGTFAAAAVANAVPVRIYERGRLVEDGTHDELIKTGGRYAMLHRLQAGIHEVR